MFQANRLFQITLAFIFTSTASAQEGYVRIEINTNKGCNYSEYVKPERIDIRKTSKVIWSGKCSSGYISGPGTLTILDSEGKKSTINTNYDNGLEDGYGIFESEDTKGTTSRFEGMYQKGFRVKGTVQTASADGKKTQYTGEFTNGRITGNGQMTYHNGTIHEGEFLDGFAEGRGKRTTPDGSILDGNFLKGRAEGRGTLKFSNGDVYTGDFVKDSRTGHGEYRWANGNIYTGEFVNGKINGPGKVTNPNGDIFERVIRNDKIEGSAIYKRANGDMWYLEYRDGVKISETPSSSNKQNPSGAKPTEGPDLARRQRGIDHMTCQTYAKNAVAGQQISTIGSGAAAAAQAFIQGTLISMNQQDAYDSCMKNLGW